MVDNKELKEIELEKVSGGAFSLYHFANVINCYEEKKNYPELLNALNNYDYVQASELINELRAKGDEFIIQCYKEASNV